MQAQKTKRSFAVAAVCLLAVAATSLIWSSSISTGATPDQAFKQQIRNGLAEVGLPTSNNLSQISAATNNLADFVYYRSGVQISNSNKSLLGTVEQSFWADSKRIAVSQLSEILTDVIVERIPQLTDTQIASATETLRGFNAPGLPTGFQQGRSNVKLRANGEGTLYATDFQSEVTSIRNGGVDKAEYSAIANRVALEVERKVNLLSSASPEYFGNAKSGLTPMQALLITYSVATDDPLAYNQTGLQSRMQSLQQGISHATGQQYPSPSGNKAYGENGYLFSTPVSLVLNDSSITRVLNRISEQGVQQ
ncbi:MAG: hypothetical protein ACK4S4_03795 [Pyrinomonadaceae bacterium]